MSDLDLAGYKLTFDDEFNTRSISFNGGGTAWADSRSEWRMADGVSDIGFGISSFVDAQSGYDPFSVNGGALTITAVPDRTAAGCPGSWESGLITTQGTFSQTYGYFEMRADLSNSPGAWDAFWLLPNQQQPGPSGSNGWQEIDGLEHYGIAPSSTYRFIHTTDANPTLQVTTDNPEQASGYHTYGIDWEADQISFYFDGKFMGAQATPSDMHNPMYMIADLAVTANDLPAGATSLDPMKIDYIRAFSKDAGAVAIAQQSVSAPDGADPGLHGATTASVASNGPATESGCARPCHATGCARPGHATGCARVCYDSGGARPGHDTHQSDGSRAYGRHHASHGSGRRAVEPARSQDHAQRRPVRWRSPGADQRGWEGRGRLFSHGRSCQRRVAGRHPRSRSRLDRWRRAQCRRHVPQRQMEWNARHGSKPLVWICGGRRHAIRQRRRMAQLGRQRGAFHVPRFSGDCPCERQHGACFRRPATGARTCGDGERSQFYGSDAGTGGDLHVILSGDQYDGAPIARIAVDGTIVAEQAVTADHSQGQWQDVVIQGPWAGDAAHDVTVTFLNDKWNGTPDTDRNLWYLGAELNGINPEPIRNGSTQAAAWPAPTSPRQTRRNPGASDLFTWVQFLHEPTTSVAGIRRP